MFFFLPQGVSGGDAPQVLSPKGKGHCTVSTGGRAGVGHEHQESSTEYAPDLPHSLQRGNRERGGKLQLIFSCYLINSVKEIKEF